MQIGNSIYLDLEIKGSSKKNFLSYADAIDFQIIETAGASLPLVYVNFVCKDPKIVNLFQENNIVIIKFGTSEENCDSFNVQIMKPNVNNDPSGNYQIIEFIGYIGNLSYMVSKSSKVYKGRSLHVANKLIKEYFGRGIQTQSSDSNEEYSQWRQNNQTACQFLANLLLHSDLRPSFPLFSFNKYGEFKVLDLDNLYREGAKYTLTPNTPRNYKELRYFNNFQVENYSTMYNAYSGFDKMTEVLDVNAGSIQSIINKNTPILGATSVVESCQAGNLVQMNNIQSSNVHSTYQESFAYNTNKLMSLSSMIGMTHLMGVYYRDLHPLDLVNLKTDSTGKDTTYDGLYLIDTIITRADFSSGTVHTYVYVTRDNKNNVEDYVAEKKELLKILQDIKNKILSAVSDLKTAYAFALTVIDGTYMQRIMSFAIATKNNLLRSFSVAGVTADLTSAKNMLTSLISIGNSLMNSLCDMIFPENIAATLRDFILFNKTLKNLLVQYIAEYVPVEVRDIISMLADKIFDITDSLNSIAKDNNVDVTGGVVTTNTVTEETDKNQQRVDSIIKEFSENTKGVDIPFPIVDLNESQSLYTDEDLKDLIANETINNLTDLGYMNGVDSDDLYNVLLGNSKISYQLIDALNSSAGSKDYYRYYGTYKSEVDLVGYLIKKGFKDKYRTLPCTKIISALGGSGLFFACPSSEEDIKFYINSKREELPSFETDLGYTTTGGATIMYTVYYTPDEYKYKYNSNSVLLEVKQGGVV